MRTVLAATVIPAVLLSFWIASVCCAGPTVTVGANVSREQLQSMDGIEHDVWSQLLGKYVDADGYVDYASWKASTSDVQALDAYLAHLSTASLEAEATRAAQWAFWINAYNAVTIRGILREYPTTSIRNHTAAVVGYNIWKDLHLLVGGQPFSLDAMEHEVLRSMGDPRIHFAIVCASVGCPRLLSEAYTADRLEVQLNGNARAFFADATKLRLDTSNGTLHLSPILDWFGDDFGADSASQLRAIAPYLPEDAQRLALSGRARIRYLEYDWGLNDQARRQR